MRVTLDRKRCEGFGLCQQAAPALYSLDDDANLPGWQYLPGQRQAVGVDEWDASGTYWRFVQTLPILMADLPAVAGITFPTYGFKREYWGLADDIYDTIRPQWNRSRCTRITSRRTTWHPPGFNNHLLLGDDRETDYCWMRVQRDVHRCLAGTADTAQARYTPGSGTQIVGRSGRQDTHRRHGAGERRAAIRRGYLWCGHGTRRRGRP